MSFQDIRKYYEYPVIDCCNLARIQYRAENTLEPGGDAISKYVTARLQFGEMAEQTIACGPLSNKRAVFIVEYFGPKGTGPKDAQDFMECIICSFHELKGIVSINGPDFGALDNRPYFFARVSFGIRVPGNVRALLPTCPDDILHTVTCDCTDGAFYICGDIMDGADVSICDYDDPSTFPPGGLTEYDNADVINPEDLNMTLEDIATENNCVIK